MTVHLVYVNGRGVDTTTSIAREVSERLAAHHPVTVHHPNSPTTICPEPGDVLIGHPNRYDDDSVFNRSFRQKGWSRRIVFAPFSHGLLDDAALIDGFVREADVYLAITGSYWFDAMEDTPVSHWRFKTRRCGLGIRRDHFPLIKKTFNPPGQRRFLYIGNADPMRGGDFLARLADTNPHLHLGWIRASDSRDCLDVIDGRGTKALRTVMERSRLVRHEAVHWRRPEGLPLVLSHDFILGCSRSDALNCDILEAVAWGLVPVATPQCGLPAAEWLTHIPLDDVRGASEILDRMNLCSTDELLNRQQRASAALERDYNWDGVAQQVREAIEAPLEVEPHDRAFQHRKAGNVTALRRIARRNRIETAIERALNLARPTRRVFGIMARAAGYRPRS